MEEKNSNQRKTAAELRKIAISLVRGSMLVLVVTILGWYLDWLHWSWIVAAAFSVIGAYFSDVILNALADISEKVDRLVENLDKATEG